MNQFIDQMVETDFARTERGAICGAVLAALARRPNTLLSYHEERRRLLPIGASDRGLQVVSVAQIVGSTDRAGDFDRAFRLRAHHAAGRWKRIARAAYEGAPLPPIRLYQVGDGYFVVDGHHRVSVARALGQQFIDAVVIEELVQRSRGGAAPVPLPRWRLGRWVVDLVRSAGGGHSAKEGTSCTRPGWTNS